MIFDSINNLKNYSAAYPEFSVISDYLASHPILDLPAGTYEINGKELYFSRQSYDTQDASVRPWECHRRYLDVQYVISGTEYIYEASLDDIGSWEAYNEANDSAVSRNSCIGSAILLKAGDFLLLTPDEGHKPRCSVSGSGHVEKAVIKILI